jgi:hypothetical protein
MESTPVGNPCLDPRVSPVGSVPASARGCRGDGTLGSSPTTLGIVARSVSPGVPSPVASLPSAAGARRFMRQAAARELVPSERVAVCLRRPVPGAPGVEVWRDLQHAVAHYKQLLVCGSVWMCAPCAARITEVRREELSEAVRAWAGQIALATLTLQHSASDGLSGLLEALLEAARKVRQGKGWRLFEERFGVEFEARGTTRRRIGTIRALEVTDGLHGFHPHLHLLVFLPGGVDMDGFAEELRDRWLSAVARVGRYAHPEWGIDVRHADAEIADYVSKWAKEPQWTVAHELAKGASKAARADGDSMAMLLDRYALAGDEGAGRRWKEYAECFKGKHQLVWSDGLRALLLPGLAEKSDEEIVNAADEESVLLAQLELSAWRSVLANDARYELLEAATTGVEELRRFLTSLGITQGVFYEQS